MGPHGLKLSNFLLSIKMEFLDLTYRVLLSLTSSLLCRFLLNYYPHSLLSSRVGLLFCLSHHRLFFTLFLLPRILFHSFFAYWVTCGYQFLITVWAYLSQVRKAEFLSYRLCDPVLLFCSPSHTYNLNFYWQATSPPVACGFCEHRDSASFCPHHQYNSWLCRLSGGLLTRSSQYIPIP